MVHGNCQAESLRLALDGAGWSGVRIPPVHELEAADLPYLDRCLTRCDLLIAQPVRSGYRGLALGTDQLAAGPAAGTPIVRVPVIRFAGLFPTQAIVRVPSDPSLGPPLVPYHDLRGLAAAAGRHVPERLSAGQVRQVAAGSLAELRRRERAHATVEISDVFERPDFAQMRTLNHPGNPVWERLAVRVRERVGADPPRPLSRPILDAIRAPRAPEVIEAFELDVAATEDWWVDGVRVEAARVTTAHRRFYRDHPDVVAAGLARHAQVLAWLADA